MFDSLAFTNDEQERQDLIRQVALFREDGAKFLLVGNKVDLADTDKLQQLLTEMGESALLISAKDKGNIHQLSDGLYELVAGGSVNTEGTIVTNARHYAALQQVLNALNDIRKGMDDGLPGDLLSLDIRRCLHYLGEITGAVTTEDKLDYIFSKFCIGK